MGGNTCIKCGLEKAGEALSKRGCGRTAEQKVILLLVEGNENVAGSNVYNTAAGLRSSGHLIYVMAIGKSVSLSSMTQIAGSRNRVFQTEFDDLATYDIERLYIALTSSFCTAYGLDVLTGVPSSKEYVNRYGSLLLTCVATDNSNVQIKWFRNGVEINHDVMVLYMVHEISDTLLGYYVSSLRINYATNVTNGTYSCRAQGIKHTEQFFTEVEVYYAAQIVGYTSYVVVGDEMAVLQCSARGNPLPTFTWFKGSSRISFTSVKYTRNDTSYSDVTQSILVIRNPTDHDLTTYTCKAENTIAENIPITVEKSITVYATSLPHFQQNLVDGPIRVKATLTLNVSVTSSPNSTFVWYRNSIIISQPVTKTTRQFTTSNFTSQTNTIQLNTSGFYFVEACNIGGCVRSKTAKVEIEGHVSMKNYSFLQPVQNLTEGQSHTHECIATGYPEPIQIYWYLTVRSIRSQQQAGWTSFRSGQNFISRLDYSFIDKDDGGVLECVATNGVLRASVSTTIAVKYKPKLSATPALVKYVALGSNDSLSCVAYGKEPPTIKWSKKTNYATLNYTNVHIDNRTGQVISILRLQQASFNDAGTYMCNASNSAGSNYFTTRLEIHFPVKIYQYPPAILQASENDSNYNISCYASGSPEPRILWLKNGVAVSFTELYRIRNVAINSSAVLSTLELKVVNKIDHANWSCQASNVLVGNQSTFDIATTLLNVAYVPDFNSTQKLRTVAEGSDVSLPCQVISYPASNIRWIGPVDFTIDPRFLLDDLKLVEVQSSYVVVERTLNIHNVSRMDAGYYNCSAINSEERKVYRQIELVVHYPVEIYQRPPKVSRASEFDTEYNMMCDASGLPLPTISWLKNGVMFFSSRYSIRITTFNSSAVSSILTVKNVEQSDHGNWTCRARNSLVGGQSRSDSATTLLKVTHDPAFILYPPGKHVEIEGSNVSLICRVKSYPASNISWDGPVNFAINERFVLEDQKAVEIESNHEILERILKIQNVSRMDAGYYNCSAVNTDSETLQKPTYLNVQFPVKIYQRPPNVSKVEESAISYNLSCYAEGWPRPTISWFRDDVNVVSTYRVHLKEMNFIAISVLEIINVNQSHYGNWSCLGKNVLNQSQETMDRATTLLRVLYNPIFLSPPTEKQRTVIEGSAVSLVCQVRSYPASNVSWNLPDNFQSDGRFVFEDQKVVLKSNDAFVERTLKIQNVSRKDAGLYNCSASNSGDRFFLSETRLVVQFPVKIYQRPPDVSRVNESVKSYNISCFAEGWPRPTISWFKNDVNVMSMYRVHLKEMNFIAISVLEIINVNQSHYGNWSCLGKNVLNQSQETMDRATTLLRVLYNPIFLSPPTEKQRTVIEGSDLSLVCQVRSYPASNVSWNLPGNFQSDARFVFENQKVVLKSNDVFVERTLKIQNVSRIDAGLYRCSANNTGHMIFLRETRLVVQYASSIVTDLNGGMHRIMEGSRLELHFGITSVPPSNFTWTMDGVVLLQQTGQEGTSLQTSFFNRKIFRIQSAQYRASACNFLGCINSRITNVIVEFPPTHKIQQASIAVEQNKKVNFTCTVSSEPVSSILWFYKGRELAVDGDNVNVINSANVSKYFTTATSFVSIRNIRKDTHSGVYTCKATNKVDVVNHTIELIVVLNPPELVTKLNSQYNVNSNSNLSLSCVARSNELPHIVWYKDNVQIRNDSNNALLRHVSDKETINVTLLIQPVKDTSTGVYRCEATNVAGSAKNVTQVTVHYPPRINKSRSNILRTIEFTRDYTNLSCSATSHPNPTFVWFKDGVERGSNPRYVITNTILYSRITIKNVLRRDFGKWTCMARNRLVGNLLRTDAFTITLLVSYSPGFTPSYPKQLYLAAEGNNVSLICRVNSYPPPSYVRWTTPVNVTIDNQRVFVQDDVRHADNKTLGTVLVITNVSRTDSGFYTCDSSNSQGTKNKSTELKVQYLPVPEDLKDQVVFVSGNAVLKCTVIGEPLPNITWWFNEKQVLSDVTHKFISHVINDEMIQVTSVLNIFNVKKEQDEGVYTCRATNDIDTGEKNVTLTVQAIPDGFKAAPEKKFNGLFEYYGLALKIQGINFSISDITTQRDFMKDEFNRSLVLALTSIFNDIVNNSVVAVTIQKPFINKQVNFTITLKLTVTESTKQLTKSFQDSLMKNDGQLFQNGSSFCASVNPDTITVLDYNECDFASNCSKNAYCLNLNESSSYACKCKPGYTGNGFVCVVNTDKENIFIITLATIIAFGIIVVIALLYLARRKLKKETEKFKSNVQKQMAETDGYKNGRVSDPKVWMNNLPQDTLKIKIKNKRKK